MTSPSDQAALVAGSLRAKPDLLCHLIANIRNEKLAGDWEGETHHQARSNPYTGMPVCAIWRDTKLPDKQWRWAVRVEDGSAGICSTKEHAKAAATINLRGRGYTLTNWKEDDDE